MNAFVTHSGADFEQASRVIAALKQKAFSLNTLILKNGSCFWKIDAGRKIKKSQMVIFVVGENSHKSPYIGWELKEAIRTEKPIYVLKLQDDYMLHDALYVEDDFSKEKRLYAKVVSIDEMCAVIKNYDAGDYGLFNAEPSQLNQNIILEQYKLFLQTSEDLVERRQKVNSFYISVCSMLVTLIGAIFAMDFDMDTSIVVCCILCVIGVILSFSWSEMLSCYGKLNSSKMKIISNIEKQLPLSLFDAEWAALSDKLNKKKYVSFTESEQRIPKLFGLVYLCVIAFLLFIRFF